MGTKRLDSIGEWWRYGLTLPVVCRRCGHSVEVPPAALGALILRYGSGKRPEWLPWRCTRCGASARGAAELRLPDVLVGRLAAEWLSAHRPPPAAPAAPRRDRG